ncbi:MAG: NAD-dependent epimerase/dehydratase family protein [Bergeyella sp.]|nr:NAD-dependent epimerase/dehydratase family protein [Bergeyella sp.]
MVLVTGGTGILGRVLVLDLLRRGKSVRATKRESSDINEVLRSYHFYTDNPKFWFDKVDWVDLDLEDTDSIEHAMEGVEEVYHSAAKVSFDPAERKELYKINVEGTKNILQAAIDVSVKKFLMVSSIAVLDPRAEQTGADESSYYNAEQRHSAYAESKHFSEMEAWRASAEGMNVVIINPGIIIGSGNWLQSSGLIFEAASRSRYTFSGGSSYVDVRDVSKIAISLMEKSIFGERFVLVSEEKSYREVTQQIRKFMGKSGTIVIPNRLLYFSVALKGLSFLFPRLRLITKTNIGALTRRTAISNEKIKKHVEVEFIPVKDSIDFHLKNYVNDKTMSKTIS